ncbi:HAD-like domain-containing protein [Apiospora marii]|uniref:Mitochondrial import inner membrane translocase subunit TIM50 n=1 Tax=Apiospora marii TaxID=335849 RepID=A0ABR1R6R8_9PEZI
MSPLNQRATEAKVDTMPNKKKSNGLPAKPPPVKAHAPFSKKGHNQKQNQNQNKTVPEVRPYFPPSKASGGVPDPSAQYMAQSAIPPTPLPEPRRILVVIDLNGTLLYRPSRKNPSRFVERPHTRQFLDYCLNTFCVAIWSSAKPDNVHKMANQLLTPEERAKLVAVWGRDTLGLSPDDYNNRVQCYKRLSVIWADLARRLGQRWDQTNTVLVDDSSEKARSEPFNLIQLPEFEGDLAEQGFVLPQVHDFLNECAQQRDISSYIRAKRFAFKPDFVLGAPV